MTHERSDDADRLASRQRLVWTLWTIHATFGISVLAWPLFGLASVFAFDAPGSEENTTIWVFFWAIWTYPVSFLVGFITSWILYRTGASSTVTTLSACMPLLNIAIVVGSLIFGTW